jgi:DMSO/TMAO reductase YedYZ heme-binding membrane subunit
VKNWRRLHYATYLTFIGATAHGLMSGTDSSRPWALAAYVVIIATVVGLTAWRAAAPPGRPVPRRAGADAPHAPAPAATARARR